MKRLILGILCGVAILTPMPAANADPDTSFADELHTYGIYGQKDYNAWIAKIGCKRLDKGVDANAEQTAQFIFANLAKGTRTEQSWRFLAAALRTYCPEQLPILENVATQ